MIRCALFAAAAVCALPAVAQMPRNFPANALRGSFVVTQPPNVLINGQPARLAPGSRIRGANNLIALSGTLVGQRYIANYTIDVSGLVMDVWLLTPKEAANRPWPTTPQEAAAWQFNPYLQTWTKP